jgi:hypothetical protein
MIGAVNGSAIDHGSSLGRHTTEPARRKVHAAAVRTGCIRGIFRIHKERNENGHRQASPEWEQFHCHRSTG